MACNFVIIANSRSGHHAIANWLRLQCDPPGIHINDCRKAWDKGVALPYSRSGQPKALDLYKCKAVNEDLPSLIFTIENPNLDLFLRLRVWEFECFKSSEKTYFLYVLRDHYNWVASILKYRGLKCSALTSDVKRWKFFANEYSNPTVIPGAIPVSFNKWFLDRTYRKQLCTTLGLKFTDGGLNHVPEWGFGSSFDKGRFKGKGQEMKVLARWEQMKISPRYRRIVKDPVMVEFTKKLFDFCPDIN